LPGRELLGQPTFQTESRDNDRLSGKRIAQRRSHHLCERVGEKLKTIAGVEVEAGFSMHVFATISHRVGQKLSD